ncbi:MAG TPA: C25 family cysteine peptidase [Gemmataceae bacterium]|nr:C25 family cysteine peptidase [Gemmataceae bacterium]
MRFTPRLLRPLMVLAILACGVAPRPLSAAAPARVVYLVGELPDEDLLTLTSAVAAREPAPVVLFDTPGSGDYLKGFLAAFRPERVVPVGTFADDTAERERRLGVSLAPALTWNAGSPGPLLDALFPQAERVVVCPSRPRGLLLQAACLAGAARAPLFVLRGQDREADELARRVADWRPEDVFAVGEAAPLCRKLKYAKVTALADEAAVSAEYLRRQLERGKVEALVVANPADAKTGVALARLAPWVALQRRGALLLTNAAGDNTAALVRAALKNADLRRAENLILVADLKAIPMEHRKNPAEGKDAEIEMEPLTPEGEEAFTFATGRLFSDDPGLVALALARQRLMAGGRGPRKAVVASDPGGGLPLLEMFSRHTARELQNRGYDTTAMFGEDVKADELRRAWPDADLFLWEGHYKTMVEEFKVPTWTEPLRPSLVFLQSCLALNPTEVKPLMQRGAVAVVGSSTRTYSGTGGAFSLAFFDATLYEDQSLGASLRQSKNFILAYSLLKQKRLGENAKLTGANVRSAWAFTLWGDPTLKLPLPDPPRDALPGVHHQVKGDLVSLVRPDEKYEQMKTEKHLARTWPNARLAGLVTKAGEDEDRHLVPLLFAEVRLTPPAAGRVPKLNSRVSANNYVFVWDGRRDCGYLLVVPPSRAHGELLFDVRWGE